MRVILQSGEVIGHGVAPDNTPSMDADFALLMLGAACYEVNADGSRGRSIDPTHVRADKWWTTHVEAHRAATSRVVEAMKRSRTCEALRSRDPGAS